MMCLLLVVLWLTNRVLAQEPVAFWGGVTAGALGLTLAEDPLRTWIAETSAEAGVRHWLSTKLTSNWGYDVTGLAT